MEENLEGVEVMENKTQPPLVYLNLFTQPALTPAVRLQLRSLGPTESRLSSGVSFSFNGRYVVHAGDDRPLSMVFSDLDPASQLATL